MPLLPALRRPALLFLFLLTAAVLVPTPARGAPPVPDSGWLRWPLAGKPDVVRGFDPPAQPWLPGHRGVDLAAHPGDPVRAAGPGVVAFAGVLAGRGVVSVLHPSGIRTTYEPVRPSVAAGDRVAAGALLGLVDPGHAGCAATACLHWGARRGDTYLDPVTLIGPPRLRLKPLDG